MKDATGTWILLGLFACGGGDGRPAKDTSDPTPTDTDATDTTEVTVLVEAATGGTVEAFGATLVVPPGSLSADTEITVTSGPADGAPDADSVIGDLFDFGPDGLAFSIPATLTLPATGTPASDERFVVSWLDGATWTDLASTAGGGTVQADVAHFTSFAARAVASVVDSSECAPAAGCGGDPAGTWTAIEACTMSAGEVPFACEVGYVDRFDADVGSLTFATDHTLVATQGGGDGVVTQVVPAACVPAGINDCATLYDSVELETTPTCTGDVAVACTCVSPPSPASVGISADTWAVEATTLVLHSPGEYGSTIERRYEYCVDGDLLTIWDTQVTRTFSR